MKNKTILSFLAAFLMTALFFSCAIEPAAVDNGSTASTGEIQEDKDQIIVTAAFTEEIKALISTDPADKAYVSLAKYKTDTEYTYITGIEYSNTATTFVVDKSYYEKHRTDKMSIGVSVKLSNGKYATNHILHQLDNRTAGTKRITVNVDYIQ